MFEGPFMRYIKQSPFIGDRWSGIIFLEVYVLGKTTRSIPTPRLQEAPDRGLIDSESLTPGATEPHPRDRTHRIGPLLLCNTCFILDMHVAWHVKLWTMFYTGHACGLTCFVMRESDCNLVHRLLLMQYNIRATDYTILIQMVNLHRAELVFHLSFHSMLNGLTQLAPTQP